MGYHFRQAGDARAAAWLVRAGERAQRAYAWQAAIERFEAAVTLMERGRTGRASAGLAAHPARMAAPFLPPPGGI